MWVAHCVGLLNWCVGVFLIRFKKKKKNPPHAACFSLSFIRIKYASVRGKTAERVPARQVVSQEDTRNIFSTTLRNSGFQKTTETKPPKSLYVDDCVLFCCKSPGKTLQVQGVQSYV